MGKTENSHKKAENAGSDLHILYIIGTFSSFMKYRPKINATYGFQKPKPDLYCQNVH